MSIKANDRILQGMMQHLSTFSPAYPVASENKPYSPTLGMPYLEVHHNPQEPFVATINATSPFTRYEGNLEITLHFPISQGMGTAKECASRLMLHFDKGTVITQDGDNILVIKSWETRGYPTDNWWNLPVFVQYRCYSQD